ncbi:molybdopterin-dependent oxidoreductase [Nonomuraea sp. KM88]|uniref:molybdopterin-dependent oxidoreductase n=1 Tax=Nonomuraea sp. KM88 TaxID=3457427 RepID=UPI003FCE216A
MNPSTISARFTSRLRSEQVAAKLGVWLGVSFTVAFVTGLFSHFMQHPPAWLLWPSRPVNLYRFTQGLHVIGGIATVPLLLAKLWAVHPKLWQWPPFRSAGHAAERLCVLLLVAGALFQLVTGALNIAYLYPYPFGFLQAHYWTAYVVYGALLIHVANEWAKVRRNLWTHVESQERRRLLLTVAAAGVTTVPDGYRLLVTGAVRTPASLGYADLLRLPQHTVRLPIACVEGWSVECEWTGVRLRDLLLSAGASPDAFVVVESLERAGGYRSSEVRPPHWSDPLTLLALRINGETLSADHGFPVRLIAPNRPGVLQTKWVKEVKVT